MNEHQEEIESNVPVTIFKWPQSIWSSPAGYLALGTACLLLALVSITLGFRFDQDLVARMAYGACFALSAGFLWAALLALRTPHTVVTGEHGVVLIYRKRETTHPWTNFAHAMTGISGASNQPYLILFDSTGRRLTKLSGDIEHFDALSEIVQRKISEARMQTEERVPLQRSWLLSATFILVGSLLGPTACFFAWLTIGRFGEFVSQSEGGGNILGYALFLGMWLFGIVMSVVFVGAAVLHLARIDIKRNPSGFGFAIQREPEY